MALIGDFNHTGIMTNVVVLFVTMGASYDPKVWSFSMDSTVNLTVADGMVVSLDYELIVEGDLIDSTNNQPPLEYVHGCGNIINGLERALAGMQVSEVRDITVPAKDAYGEIDPQAYAELDRKQFPANFPLEVGAPLHVRDEKGQVRRAYVSQVGEETVRLDLNHPLAGKDLHFRATIAGLRIATPEELAAGRVGGGCAGCSSGDCSSGSCH